MEKKSTRGGARPGSGRPATTNLKHNLMVRISKEAADKLSTVHNKSEYINNLIINAQ